MVFHVPYVLIPFFVWSCAQVTKLVIDYYYGRSLHWDSLRSSGWFPSTHGTLTSSMLTVVFLTDWRNSNLFLLAAVLSFLVRYDAANVRYESGKHAQHINSIKKEIDEVLLTEHLTLKNKLPSLLLKERIGHTPLEVIGGILYGTTMTLLAVWLLGFVWY